MGRGMAPEIANVAARELPPLSAVASPSYGEVVLVTGGSGFLGQHVIKHLHERDPRVREIRILDLVPFLKLLGNSSTLACNMRDSDRTLLKNQYV
uniref:3-beta hydroxysteroid dehydrogenase/isomerase domain-containing protein n=1 Tax=Timema shepardi TaxID=629360 RepID=A0A7R9G6H5_TIMSH|nr:unnamed protein product [Timema shepardi]